MIFSAADNGQIISLNIDLHVFGGDAGKLNFYDPAFVRLVNIGRRIPKLSGTEIL